MACGNPFELDHMGPIVRVRAAQERLGGNAITLYVGEATGLALTVFDATHALIATDVTWTTRNSQIASNVGSRVTAVAPGDTYVVGSTTDNGNTFRDSVRITVIARPTIP